VVSRVADDLEQLHDVDSDNSRPMRSACNGAPICS
jgi:hypothetical protein